MERVKFTFFRSYLESALALDTKEEQADFLLAVCIYGLDGIPPEKKKGSVAAAFAAVKPNLDTSLAKAKAGSAGGSASRSEASESNYEADESREEANRSNEEANASNLEAIKKEEVEKGNKKKEVLKTLRQIDVDFDAFWSEYPKKVGKGAARKAFEKARKKATLESLVTAVRRQKCGSQWTREDGRFIPNPATWLNQERWDDEVDGGTNNGTGEQYFEDPGLRRLWEQEQRDAL